jgi:carotenoid cleavage dioxygenase
MIDDRLYMQRDVCRDAFRTFDLNGDGKVTREELWEVLSCDSVQQALGARVIGQMNREGRWAIDFDEFYSMMVDLDGDGTIDFEEFCSMMVAPVVEEINHDIADMVKVPAAPKFKPSKPALLRFLQTVDSWTGQKLPNPFVDGRFAPVRTEVTELSLEVIEGAIPLDFPDGLYVRNGPNPRFETTSVQSILGRSAHHWFEGDGMLHAVRFTGGKASFRNRYVRTSSFLREEAAGESFYRPAVMTTGSATILNAVANSQAYDNGAKDQANTSIVFHGGRLLAITEGAAMPTEVSPLDLSTRGMVDFGGQLPAFTAHPRVDPKTGDLVFVSYSFFQPNSDLEGGVHIGVVGPNGVLKHSAKIPSASRNTLMHDCAITEKWTVVTDFPLVIDPSQVFTKEGLLSFKPNEKARIGLAPRFGNDVEHWFDVATGFAFHLMNAYEDGDEVVLRGCRADSVDLSFGWEWGNHEFGSVEDREGVVRKYLEEGFKACEHATRLYEWRLNLRTGAVAERKIGSSMVDFPLVNPNFEGQKHRHGYCSAAKLEESITSGLPVFSAIEKYTFSEFGGVVTEQHVLPSGCGGGEASFVPRPGGQAEDDGWLLVYTQDEEGGSELRIIDAQDFTGRPVARVALPQRVPFGFHGTWAPGI